eukprot:6179555-Pleurochrysis_carterae.AAC.1
MASSRPLPSTRTNVCGCTFRALSVAQSFYHTSMIDSKVLARRPAASHAPPPSSSCLAPEFTHLLS